MKILLLFVVLISCFLIGFYIKQYFNLREKTYQFIVDFTLKLENSILYNSEKLENFVKKEIALTKGFIKKFYENFDLFLSNKQDTEEFKKVNNQIFYFLSKNEIEEISLFFLEIGQRTKDEEIQFLNNKLVVFKQNLKDENLKRTKFGSLFLKLFIILGFMLFIIFL